MEDTSSKLNVGRSFKLFYPYLNEDMGSVCIVRELDDNGYYKNGIVDIFAEKGFDGTELKGFRYPDRVLSPDELKNKNWLDDGFLIFTTYIQENYGFDFSDEYTKYINLLNYHHYYSFKTEKLIFTVYRTHRRIRHKCHDDCIDVRKSKYKMMCTITEKTVGYSFTHCPLCLGASFNMCYEDYKKLNAIHKFL